MTTNNLSFTSLPSIAIAVGATTPNPGIVGVQVWSTTEGTILVWSGSSWQAVSSHGTQDDPSMHALAVAGGNAGFMSGADKTRVDNMYQREVTRGDFSGYTATLADCEKLLSHSTAGWANVNIVNQATIAWPEGATLRLTSETNDVISFWPEDTSVTFLGIDSGIYYPRGLIQATRLSTDVWLISLVPSSFASPDYHDGLMSFDQAAKLATLGEGTTVSAGAGDVGKVPLLDASGMVDASCLSTTDVDLTPQTTQPSGNSADQIYAQNFGRQSALAVYPSQAGGERALRLYEPAAWTHRKRTWQAPASGTNPVVSIWSAFTVTGLAIGLFTGPARLMYGTPATAGSSTGLRATTGTVRGANGAVSTVATPGYGFVLAARFLLGLPMTRFFFGVTGAALTNQDPVAGATANNSVGFYKDASDTGIGFMQRNTVAGNVNNTANAISSISTSFYDLVLSVARDTAANLKVAYAWRCTSSVLALTWSDWTVSEAALDGSSITSATPNLATFWINNGTNAVDQYISCVSMYQEQDWGVE